MMFAFYVAIPVGLITEKSAIFGVCGVWLVYIVSSCCTNTTKYIYNTVNIDTVFTNIEAAILARPICKLHIQNYHYENRTTTTTDSKGNKRTHTKRVRVNTHRASEGLRFKNWVDKSPPSSALHYIDLFLLTRIYTHKIVNLAPQARANYKRQKQDFIKRNHKDTHYDYNFTRDIPCHETHCLAYNSAKGSNPWFTNHYFMICLDLIFLGWYQRWELDNNSVRVEYTLEKYILY